MKTIFTICVLTISAPLMAQTYNEKISKEYAFEKKDANNAVMIANINGNIKVEGYNGDKIIVEVNKSIHAKTDERLEKGKQQIQLGVLDLADTLIFYVQGTQAQFGRKDDKRRSDSWYRNNYGYNWCCNGNRNCSTGCDCDLDFDFKMDFVVKVPQGVHVMVTTINDGDINVSHVGGAVSADNINGSIKLTDLMREAHATTINGNVDVEYTSNPKKDCRFYTLNGDINAWFQKGLAASMSFESFNGSFFTNIDKLETLPAKVEKESNSKGMKYKINDNRYKIGAGGAFLDFETFNGNVYLKERTN